MFLKALEMRGFKSFPDKTRLDFEKGITAIVGPNGSGKSNISDAVRWVLGEMSPKSLRGQKMEDVIFSGTAKRQQTGFCEVSLILDNSDGALPDDHEEVKITRKYYRSGDSEYKINDKTSRLRDIYELFLNTGIGREGYSVIGQGKIGEVISQKSDERRHIFEEAAGISKFRYRKNDAEKKLAETENNLVRLRDIVAEIETRIGPLEKASENAKKYLVLADRKKELEVAIWVDRIAKAAIEAESFESRTETARKNYEEKDRELTEAEEKTNSISEQKFKKNMEAEDLRTQISELETEKNDISSKCALSENDISHYNERMDAIVLEKNAISEGELKILREELLSAQTKSEESKAILEAASGILSEKQRNLDAANEEFAKAEAQKEALLSEKRAIDEEIIANRISTSAAQSDEKSANERRRFIESEIEKTEKEIAEVTSYLEAAKDREKAALEEKEDLTASLREEEENLKKYATDHDDLTRIKNEIAAKYASDVHRKETLERMDKLLDGFPGSVKAVMNEESLSGICGPVSKILSVSGEYVTAIETALGAAVTNIVVENEDSAKKAISFLKEKGAGRATFLPLTSIRENIIDEPSLEKEKGFVGIGSLLVSCEKKYNIVAGYLLGRTVVADNIDNASVIARKYRFRYRIVTLDGQLINAGGSYTGGSAAAKTGAMSRNADIEALEIKINDYLKQAQKITAQLKELSEQKAESVQFAEAIKNDLSNCEGELYKARGDIKLHEERLEACNTRISHAKAQLEEFGNENGSEIMDKLEAERKLSEEKLRELTENIEKLDITLDELENKVDECEKELTDCRMKVYSAEKDSTQAQSSLSDTSRRISETEKRIALLDEEYLSLKMKLSDIKEALEHGGERIAELEIKIAERKEIFQNARHELDIFERQLSDLRTSQSDIVRDKEVFFRELTKCESALEERRKEYDTLTSKLWEEYELTYTDAAGLGLPKPDSAAVTELASVRAKIRALGSVNVNAVEEYRETKERYEFMTKQIEDLESSGKSLENVIKRLEADMKKLFSEAVEKINAQFGLVFTELFGGGSASIVITDEENILESGIEINVQPPGKMVKNISLLSGGEQAFTAIALYFAILNVNPAPFYIFDEIEAALDDVNVIRFGEYLRRHSKETQFIVITHRRGSMEAADRLYGVTMQEKGISSFLKVDVDEVEKKTGLKL
ncbi:MAG: chromosome segregation protein SMC [Ruminococcaceae bacterium]|nr:chromosome segregation protein SMC [Oscillospiraceae bacterium]